jgi:hypothetical protein
VRGFGRRAAPTRSGRGASWTGLRGEVEAEYLWPVYLGEHVAPYRSFAPALGVLPWGTAGWVEPTVADCPGLAAWWREGEARWLGHRVSEKLTLRGQFDYQQKLASQFPVSPLRVVYTKSGMHLTAAKVSHARAVVDHTLYWMAARSVDEADYLCALLNSAGVTRRVRPLMAYGKDERHIDKHVWRLPIPLFDPANPVHGALVRAARRAEAEIAGRPVAGGWIAVRREIRGFLASSAVGREIEGLVGELLGGQNGQNEEPGCLRNSSSSGVLSRPRVALRWGKRPKRAMTSRWRIGVVAPHRRREGRAQGDAAVLVGEVLAVLEREVEEDALVLDEGLVVGRRRRRRGRGGGRRRRWRTPAGTRGTGCAGPGRAG